MKHDIVCSRRVKNMGMPQAAGLVKKAVCRALDAEGVAEPCCVSVIFTDDEGIREINREFRGIDRPTDVLSFPMNELAPGAFSPDDCERDPETGCILLGDMAISIPRCVRQGEEFGHGFDRELGYLAVHSALHLLGYDHTDEGPMKRQMRKREKIIMGDAE
jgi:probable rRNA maturation factor